MATVRAKHAQDTIRRLQAAVSKGQLDLAKQIIDSLDEEQVKYLAFAMGLALFEGTTV